MSSNLIKRIPAGNPSQLVYDWERNFLEPRSVGFLSKNECLDLMEAAARITAIPVPRATFPKTASMPCKAVPSEWKVVIADWGRNQVTVLHEVAHLASFEAVLRGEDAHGPAFMGKAMQLYSRLLGFKEEWLAETATSVGLIFTAVKMPMSNPASESAFKDIDF